jgi:transposase
MTASEAKENLTKAWSTYRILKKQAMSLRATWLEEVAAARTAEGKLPLAKEIKNLKLREQQRREARQIKFVLKPSN